MMLNCALKFERIIGEFHFDRPLKLVKGKPQGKFYHRTVAPHSEADFSFEYLLQGAHEDIIFECWITSTIPSTCRHLLLQTHPTHPNEQQTSHMFTRINNLPLAYHPYFAPDSFFACRPLANASSKLSL